MTQAEMDRIWRIVEKVNEELAGGIGAVTWGQVRAVLEAAESVVQESAPEPWGWWISRAHNAEPVIVFDREEAEVAERDGYEPKPVYLHPPTAALPPVEQEPPK